MLDKPHNKAARIKADGYTKTALVLQGGGALGAYQAGVYQALHEAGIEPDWVAGISIGAINSAIIAGNAPKRRVERLREFWERITSPMSLYPMDWGLETRRMQNRFSAFSSMFDGQNGFFAPRFPPPFLQPHGAQGAASFYDTAPLKSTLEELVDFDLINARATRLAVGAVNVRLGNFAYFDNADRVIGPEHIMASGALPPGFPAIVIDGESYWDGGLVSNTPLSQVLGAKDLENTMVFQVDLFSARGALPGDLFDSEVRRKDIMFSSRTRLNTDCFREMHILKQAIVELYDSLPEEERDDPRLRELRELGDSHNVSIVHLIYRRRRYELHSSDYEFSRGSMEEHWQAGLDDTRRTLRSPNWCEPPEPDEGVRVFDLEGA